MPLIAFVILILVRVFDETIQKALISNALPSLQVPLLQRSEQRNLAKGITSSVCVYECVD